MSVLAEVQILHEPKAQPSGDVWFCAAPTMPQRLLASHPVRPATMPAIASHGCRTCWWRSTQSDKQLTLGDNRLKSIRAGLESCFVPLGVSGGTCSLSLLGGLARFVLGQHIAQDRHADAQNAGFINEGVLLYSV